MDPFKEHPPQDGGADTIYPPPLAKVVTLNRDVRTDPSQLEDAVGVEYNSNGQTTLASSRASSAMGMRDSYYASSSATERETVPLAPQDQGYAWIFLAAALAVETLAWGFSFSVGIFHEYWTTELFPGPSNASTLTLASTLMTGVMYMTAVLASPLYTRYPEWRWYLQYGGLALSVSGIVASAFVTQAWQLLITAGLLYPVGGCIYYVNAATLIFEWFNRHRGLAGAVMCECPFCLCAREKDLRGVTGTSPAAVCRY